MLSSLLASQFRANLRRVGSSVGGICSAAEGEIRQNIPNDDIVRALRSSRIFENRCLLVP